jgi:hypothetical protein
MERNFVRDKRAATVDDNIADIFVCFVADCRGRRLKKEAFNNFSELRGLEVSTRN